MRENQITLQVLSPRGKLEQVPRFPASPRLDTLAGKKIGVLKFTGNWGLTEQLLPPTQKILQKRFEGIEFREWPMTIAPA